MIAPPQSTTSEQRSTGAYGHDHGLNFASASVFRIADRSPALLRGLRLLSALYILILLRGFLRFSRLRGEEICPE